MSEATVFCNKCGQAVNAAASFCTRCGAELKPVVSAAPSSPMLPPIGLPPSVGYAGFWIRFIAVIIDGVIVFAVLAPIRFALHAPFGFMEGTYPRHFNPFLFLPFFGLSGLISIAAGWLYEAYFLSSHRQATLGKMALGIRVTGMRGERLSFAQATIRHFAKWVSNLTLFIGYIMAGFSVRKQALHDMIAQTLVLRS